MFKIGDYIVVNEGKWVNIKEYRNYLIPKVVSRMDKLDLINLLIIEEEIEKYNKYKIFIVVKTPTIFGTFEATCDDILYAKLKTRNFKLATWEQIKEYQLKEMFKKNRTENLRIV